MHYVSIYAVLYSVLYRYQRSIKISIHLENLEDSLDRWELRLWLQVGSWLESQFLWLCLDRRGLCVGLLHVIPTPQQDWRCFHNCSSASLFKNRNIQKNILAIHLAQYKARSPCSPLVRSRFLVRKDQCSEGSGYFWSLELGDRNQMQALSPRRSSCLSAWVHTSH